MCYACIADRKGVSWASFSHGLERKLSLFSPGEHDTYSGGTSGYSSLSHGREATLAGPAKWAALAAGAPFLSSVGSWFSSAYDWVSDNISGLPLGIFSAAAAGLPNVPIFGTKYYAPTNIDRDVLALFSGSQWAHGTITYSFPDSRWDYELINASASGFRPFSQASQTAFHGIFKGVAGVMSLTSLESFTNATFVYAGRNGANIKLSAFQPGSIINRSHGYYPGVPVYGGDTWITGASETPSFNILGTYQYYLFLHELGHALGMKHSHESGGNLPRMSAQRDSTEYTVMSYNVVGNPQTFMMYDIAALQEMYGADFTTNSGNTVYRWSQQTGETFVNGIGQGRPGYNNKIFLTIWDGGGVDTYDFENYNTDLKIDLTPGGFSIASAHQLSGSAKGNIYNALQYHGDTRSLIENAVGGSGNDRITGNVADNVLSGKAGNDHLNGGHGDDRLNGGTGHDTLWGSFGNDRLYGEDGNDFLAGGENGNDYLNGGNGNDTLWGGVGQDSLYGEDDNDFVAGEEGNDFLAGNNGDDTLFGGIGHDSLWGGTSQDRLYGEDGNDFLAGEAGDDYLLGGSGTDVLYGGAGNDYLDIDDRATAGADFLYGEDGNDVLVGGGVHSRLTGGAGQDIFAIRPWAKTTITDFYTGPGGHDQIQIWNKPLFANFSAMMAWARQVGSDVVIAKGEFSLTLSNKQLSSLVASDFVFL